MSDPQPQPLRSLDEQRAEYARRRGLAMPLAGLIVWTLIGIAGAFLPPTLAVWSLFIGAGFIAYLGMILSRFTGENFLDKTYDKRCSRHLTGSMIRWGVRMDRIQTNGLRTPLGVRQPVKG